MQQFLIEMEQIERMILQGLFCKQSVNVRNFFAGFLFIVSRKSKLLSEWILKLFMRNIPSKENQTQIRGYSFDDCNQFYELLCKIAELINEKYVEINLDFKSLLANSFEQIQAHQTSEKRNSNKIDKVMIGFLNLIDRILRIKPEYMVEFADSLPEFIFTKCLYSPGIVDETDELYAKCKTQESRKICYKILLDFAKERMSYAQ